MPKFTRLSSSLSLANATHPSLPCHLQTGIAARQAVLGDTLAGLQELLVYGLKGLAAYAHHAEAMGFTDPAIYADVQVLMLMIMT